MADTNEEPDDDRKPAHRRGRGKSDYYLTPVEENNIVATLLASKRWKATDDHKAIALGVTTKNMGNEDPKVSNVAVGNLIKMEKQNQADEHKATPQLHDHRHTLTIDEQRSTLASLAERFGADRVVDEIASGESESDRPAITVE